MDDNLIISYFERILSELEEIKRRLDSLELKEKSSEKLKFPLLQQWKENIRNKCVYLENINIEGEAEYFCSLIKDICNLFNCPLNQEENTK
ncbi:MAG: hypothetical protein QXD62_01545 [Candidatus Woesearchaeota archaeon]